MNSLRQEMILLLIVAISGVAAFWDVRRGEIPNRLVALLVALGVAINIAFSVTFGWRGVLDTLLFSALGMAVCALLPALLYAWKSLGGGDLKLLVAIGACLGPRVGFELQAYAYVLGSLYALVKVVYRGTLWKTAVGSGVGLFNPLLPRGMRRALPAEAMASMHFAPAVCASAIVVALTYWGFR